MVWLINCNCGLGWGCELGLGVAFLNGVFCLCGCLLLRLLCFCCLVGCLLACVFVTCLYVWLFACLRARLCVALLISFDCILFVCLVFIFLFFCLRCWGLGFRFRHL